MGYNYHINSTASYHRDRMQTLGWELTVCNALEDAASPCRSVIRNNATLGNLLYDHISAHAPIEDCASILEIGGGYGFIMRDFLRRRAFNRAAMIELSPVLLELQKQALRGYDVEFIHEDFFQVDPGLLGQFDVVMLNEVVGDFPTLCDIDPGWMSLPYNRLDRQLSDVKLFYEMHGLTVPSGTFNFNLGAVNAVERLCGAGARIIYLSEHSCEAFVPAPLNEKIRVSSTGNPERIPLMGHDEYTIRFSHLEKAAGSYGYRAIRGQYADFIQFDMTGKLNFILTSNSQKDEHEIIRQFVEDCYKYEYLLLVRG